MKMICSKQVYDQFDAESRAGLKPIPCDCVRDGVADDDCEECEGGGVVYEWALGPEDSAAIQKNLRRQGVPLGKIGTS